MSNPKQTPATDLHEFAAAVAHEIRTPLVAVAGEVELVLRRDRTPTEYREALQRIASGVAELVQISGDLTLLGEPADATAASPAAQLDTVLARVEERYRERPGLTVAGDGAEGVRVAGDEERLARAVTLVVEHAMKHRKPGAPVAVRVAAAPAGIVRLAVDAQPSGFWPHAWSSLTGDGAAPLRLRTARRILEAHGGDLLVADASGMDIVHIELQPSP